MTKLLFQHKLAKVCLVQLASTTSVEIRTALSVRMVTNAAKVKLFHPALHGTTLATLMRQNKVTAILVLTDMNAPRDQRFNVQPVSTHQVK